MENSHKKTILLIVTGSIAAYKSADLANLFVKNDYNVSVILSKNGEKFITKTTFETLTHNKCYTDTFSDYQKLNFGDSNIAQGIAHIDLPKAADLCLIAPASADIIGKIASGIADDLPSTAVLVCKCPVIFCPAMNTAMFLNSIVQDNVKKLKKFGYVFMEPESGRLACGEVGVGKFPRVERIFEFCLIHLNKIKDFSASKILITAGPTREKIDPVRFITNHSTGKMGYSLAKVAVRRGADVVLISGKTNLERPLGCDFLEVESAEEMFETVKKYLSTADIFILSAAVADFRPSSVSTQKIKKAKSDEETALRLTKTADILNFLGHNRANSKQIVVGFAMETENLIENAEGKLKGKNCDLICANSLTEKGAGFGTDTNKVTLVGKNNCIELELMGKEEVAEKILDEVLRIRKGKTEDENKESH